jgi:hypothetical protein
LVVLRKRSRDCAGVILRLNSSSLLVSTVTIDECIGLVDV